MLCCMLKIVTFVKWYAELLGVFWSDIDSEQESEIEIKLKFNWLYV